MKSYVKQHFMKPLDTLRSLQCPYRFLKAPIQALGLNPVGI